MSLTIYGFNVVLKREALDRVVNGGSESFLTRIREARHGASTVTSDEHLVAVRFPVAFLLERNDGFDVRLDFRTGGTIINLASRVPHASSK